jgi:hypothetical protein
MMAQRQPQRVHFEQVLLLVDQLSGDEQERLRIKLNSRSKAERWQALCNKVQNQCKKLPPLSDEDLLTDLKEIRAEMKAERAESSS